MKRIALAVALAALTFVVVLMIVHPTMTSHVPGF